MQTTKRGRIEVGIDWITITRVGGEPVTSFFRAVVVANETLDMLQIDHTEYPTAGKNQRFYRWILEYETGLQVAVSEDLDRQGIRVTLSGLYLQGRNYQKIARDVIDSGLKVTRVDIAIDLHDFEFTVLDVAKERQSEKYVGRKRTVTVIDGANGATLYVGSRQSEKMVRVYDKAKERGIEGRWIRCEVEYKGGTAKNALLGVLERNWYIFASDVKLFVSAQFGLIETAFKDFAPSEGVRSTIKEPDIVLWFQTSVIPAMDKARRVDSEKYNQIIDMMKDRGHLSNT